MPTSPTPAATDLEHQERERQRELARRLAAEAPALTDKDREELASLIRSSRRRS